MTLTGLTFLAILAYLAGRAAGRLVDKRKNEPDE